MATPPPIKTARPLWQRLAMAGLSGAVCASVPLAVSLYQANRTTTELRQTLHLVEIENHLARAAVLARQADYPGARDSASAFFTAADAEVQADGVSTARAEALKALLTSRDEVITLLARGDPAGADRVGAMYMNYRSAPVR